MGIAIYRELGGKIFASLPKRMDGKGQTDYFEIGRATALLELRLSRLSGRYRLWPGKDNEPLLGLKILECHLLTRQLACEYERLEGGAEGAKNRWCCLAQYYFVISDYFVRVAAGWKYFAENREKSFRRAEQVYNGLWELLHEKQTKRIVEDFALPPPSDCWFERTSSYTLLERAVTRHYRNHEVPDGEAENWLDIFRSATGPCDTKESQIDCWMKVSVSLLKKELSDGGRNFQRCSCKHGGWKLSL